jgi:hypothetical protein
MRESHPDLSEQQLLQLRSSIGPLSAEVEPGTSGLEPGSARWKRFTQLLVAAAGISTLFLLVMAVAFALSKSTGSHKRASIPQPGVDLMTPTIVSSIAFGSCTSQFIAPHHQVIWEEVRWWHGCVLLCVWIWGGKGGLGTLVPN